MNLLEAIYLVLCDHSHYAHGKTDRRKQENCSQDCWKASRAWNILGDINSPIKARTISIYKIAEEGFAQIFRLEEGLLEA